MSQILNTRMLGIAALFFAAWVASGLGADQGGPITPDRAREIALAQTGGGDVVELGQHRLRDGTSYYRLEIRNDDGEYHVEIDEKTGRLIQFIKKDHKRRPEKRSAVPSAHRSGTPLEEPLSYEQALDLALDLTEGGTVVESEVDRRWSGKVIYEFEILNQGVKSDIEIDSATGDVLKFRQRGRRSHLPIAPGVSPQEQGGQVKPRLGIADAQALAVENVGGGKVTDYELEDNHGRLVHEMKVVHGGTRYEVDIDDATGAVTKISID